jgi:hypothetical protein
MGFGATANAAFCTLGVGLTLGWLYYGPAGAACPAGSPGAHDPSERFEQIIPPAIGVGLLQGVLYRRVTGKLGDESWRENAIAIYLPRAVSPRMAFQSLFAVAVGWVFLAFPVFESVRLESWTCGDSAYIPGFNPLPLTPNWAYAIIGLWCAVLLIGMWGWVNAPRGSSTRLLPKVRVPYTIH